MKFFLSDLSIDILVMYSENIFYLGILAVEVKESVHDCEDLDSEGGAHEVQGDRGQTVTLQEGCTMRIKYIQHIQKSLLIRNPKPMKIIT